MATMATARMTTSRRRCGGAWWKAVPRCIVVRPAGAFRRSPIGGIFSRSNCASLPYHHNDITAGRYLLVRKKRAGQVLDLRQSVAGPGGCVWSGLPRRRVLAQLALQGLAMHLEGARG